MKWLATRNNFYRVLLDMTFLLGTLQAHHSQENDGSRQVVVGRVSMPAQRRAKQNKEMITVKLKTTKDPLQRHHKEKFVNTKRHKAQRIH